MKTYQFEKDGYRFKVVKVGSGEPVVVIGSAGFYPRLFADELLSSHSFYFIDFRGFAEALVPADLKSLTMEIVCEDLEYILDRLGLDKVILVGHSAHSFIAARYAGLFSQRVLGLALLCTGPRNDLLGFSEAKSLWNSVENVSRKEQNIKDEAQYLGVPGFVNYCLARNSMSWFNEKFDARPLWQGISVNEEILSHCYMQIYPQESLPDRLKDISVPVYVGLGMHDYLVAPFYLWMPMMQENKRIKISLFEKSGHYPMLEEAALFNQSFSSWIKSLQS